MMESRFPVKRRKVGAVHSPPKSDTCCSDVSVPDLGDDLECAENNLRPPFQRLFGVFVQHGYSENSFKPHVGIDVIARVVHCIASPARGFGSLFVLCMLLRVGV